MSCLWYPHWLFPFVIEGARKEEFVIEGARKEGLGFSFTTIDGGRRHFQVLLWKSWCRISRMWDSSPVVVSSVSSSSLLSLSSSLQYHAAIIRHDRDVFSRNALSLDSSSVVWDSRGWVSLSAVDELDVETELPKLQIDLKCNLSMFDPFREDFPRLVIKEKDPIFMWRSGLPVIIKLRWMKK